MGGLVGVRSRDKNESAIELLDITVARNLEKCTLPTESQNEWKYRITEKRRKKEYNRRRIYYVKDLLNYRKVSLSAGPILDIVQYA